ncbi:kelch domain-containing protein 4 isoform X2 [Diabrotica virgifera virgifera]|uniref:Kelch domain-containing protein 4 n=1 Tax=Diabrotica virgifera virgifera TaxID=50390 RepID=A0ABM5KX58_DIAVI|nr:kelch domain-containing protein 4 isoform X2 [Diabrotica virgifera virgifera]
MGKNKKDKKKGKGAEKTTAKTEKKLSNKMKKELQAKGEDDIESILLQIEKEEKKRLTVTEAIISPPSRRLNFTFMAHPEKEQLILYGGEFFNGQKTFVYGDLFFYNIPNNKWTVVKAPNGPPPRCGHQMVVSSANKGQLWVFGGEFTTPTQSQFYHYRDLWVFHLATKQWEKITAPNGPSARSGHRMVLIKKQIFVFGGFHDNLRDCKYFNDIYSFDIETYKWTKIEPLGTPPQSRSSCCMIGLNDGKILIYGGYSKEKLKKDLEKGHVYSDAFLLTPKNVAEEKEVEDIKQKVETTTISDDGIFKVTVGGAPSTSEGEVINSKQSPSYFSPSPRMNCGLAIKHGVLYLYGGMYEEGSKQVTFSDFYSLDLKKLDEWKTIIADDTSSLEWLESDSEDEDVSDDNDDEEEDVDEDEDSDESEMEVD